MDPILYWNEVALEANRRDFTEVPAGKSGPEPEQGGPTLSSRALAIVHLAMYDAYAGASNYPAVNLPAYLGVAAPVGAPLSVDGKAAAVAAAAHGALSALYPRQKPFFDQSHLQAGLTSAVDVMTGHQFGLLIAAKLLQDRSGDPSPSDNGYSASMARGAHRVDPDNPTQGYHAPYYGAKSKCFAVEFKHPLDPPPQPGDPAYLRAFREVRKKGIAPELMGTITDNDKRNADETLIGIFWGYDGAIGLGTPPRLYNQIIRKVAMARNNDTDMNARLFALVNAAMGDAGILAWEDKYVHDLWRPVVGVREHDISMGPTGAGNNNIDNLCHSIWLPLGAPNTNSDKKNFTPPFPAYPSGHATFGAAALHMTRLFYGTLPNDRNPDDFFKDPVTMENLEFVSDEFDGVNKDNHGTVRPRHTRNFPDGLWQMIIENGRSRVYLGVHWVFDAFAVNNANVPDLNQNVGGVPLGLKIAEDIWAFGAGKGPKKSPVPPTL